MKAQYIEIDDIGSKYYYSDKKMTTLHREGGPAIKSRTNGFKAWYINGLRHREDGPAIIYGSDNAFDDKYYYIHGKNVTKQEHYLHFNPPKEKSIAINGKEFTVDELNSLIKIAKGN